MSIHITGRESRSGTRKWMGANRNLYWQHHGYGESKWYTIRALLVINAREDFNICCGTSFTGHQGLLMRGQQSWLLDMCTTNDEKFSSTKINYASRLWFSRSCGDGFTEFLTQNEVYGNEQLVVLTEIYTKLTKEISVATVISTKEATVCVDQWVILHEL